MLDKTINDTQREIIRWIDKIDEVAISFEAKWGIGNLHSFVSNETLQKVNRQDEKLASAIDAQDIRSVQELAQGYIRAWAVMEQEAIALGHKPIAPEYMEVKLDSGFHLRIAKNNTQARSCTQDGVHVWSLQEIARVIEKDYTLVNLVKQTFEGSTVEDVEIPFDFAKGDDIPEF